MKLELNKLRLDGGTQPRARLDQSIVAEYAEAMEHGAVFPPVTAFHDGRHIWLAEGFHRFHAHRKIGALKIDVKMQSGTQRDAILHSCGANATHGLQRTTEDKRLAVQTLLDDPEWSQWSDREIARQCGVSHPFVAAIRNPEVAERQQSNRAKSAPKVESDSTESDSTESAGSEAPEVESDSTPTVQSSIPPGREAVQEISSGVESDSTATPLERPDTAPGPVESKPVPQAKAGSLEAENAALRARVAELEAELQETRENASVMAQELAAFRSATDPEHARKFIEQAAYIDVVTSQRDDWMNQCAMLKKEVKRLQRKAGVAA